MTMPQNGTSKEEKGFSGKKERSPSFPFVGLTKALDRARSIYEQAKKYEVRMVDIATAWDWGAKSSGTIQTAAALVSFGILDSAGSGDGRKFKLTPLALKALEDQRPGEKDNALETLALKPKLIAEYAEKWGHERPTDPICTSELRLDRGFTDDGAVAFLRVFDDSMRYVTTSNIDKTEFNNSTPEDLEIIKNQSVKQESPPTQHHPIRDYHGSDRQVSGVHRDSFSLGEGVAIVEYPQAMSKSSIDDLEDFFVLVIKKARRRLNAE